MRTCMWDTKSMTTERYIYPYPGLLKTEFDINSVSFAMKRLSIACLMVFAIIVLFICCDTYLLIS